MTFMDNPQGPESRMKFETPVLMVTFLFGPVTLFITGKKTWQKDGTTINLILC